MTCLPHIIGKRLFTAFFTVLIASSFTIGSNAWASGGFFSHFGQKAEPLPPIAKPSTLQNESTAPTPGETPNSSTAMDSAQNVLNKPLPAGVSRVTAVYFRDNRLYIKADSGALLHIKNRFVLSSPSRLVLDLENAVLSNRSLMNPMFGSTDEIRRMRVGQFDDRTIRIVIESPIPEQFESIYPGGDRSLMAITPYASTSVERLSAHTPVGEIKSIDLKRENGDMVLRLEATAPIVNRFNRKDSRIVLDFLNEASHPAWINVDPKQYPEIEKMRLEPLTDGQPNSKLFIQLANSGLRVTPTLSEDGMVLELAFAGNPYRSTTPGHDSTVDPSLSNLNSLMGSPGSNSNAKAPYAARIVIDAGHGGKDMGANRDGVNEKDLNLSLALLLKDALVEKGFKVYMTRSTDVFLPLPEISAITNEVHPDLFISIHHNASVNPALNGIETYFYTPQSIALARHVQAREMSEMSNIRDGGVKQARFYVIHHTEVPAILCEVGYVSNPTELNDLQSMDRKEKTAHAIADGVVDYFKVRISASAR